jgi:hypothetical protein
MGGPYHPIAEGWKGSTFDRNDLASPKRLVGQNGEFELAMHLLR